MTAVPPLAFLASVAPVIAALRDRVVVVKVGGSVQDDAAQMRAIMADVAALARLGMRPVVVHGGGKAISAAMNAAGLQPRFVEGQRYTDEATLGIAERVLCGDINGQLIADLEAGGQPAVGLTTLTNCVLTARRSGARDKAGRPVDLGLVGRVESVHAGTIREECDSSYVPVIAPVAMDADVPGGRLNVNADLAAGMVAAALLPPVFILVSDTPGIRTDPSNAESYAAVLTSKDIDALTRSGAIDGGMLPKTDACLTALRAGAGAARVAITDGRVPHALLGAVLTDTFPGTRVTL